MGLRGPRPRGAAHAKFMGYYRPSRHGPLPEPSAAAVTPFEVSEEEQAKRKAELEQQRRAIYGEKP